MFESALGTQEYLDQKSAEGRSADEIAARRLAAALVLANLLLAVVTAVASRERVPLLSIIVVGAVARALVKLRPRAELVALVLAVLAGVVGPIAYFAKHPILDAALQSVALWGVVGPLLMLLIGRPGERRRLGALAIFVVARGGMYFLVLFSMLLE